MLIDGLDLFRAFGISYKILWSRADLSKQFGNHIVKALIDDGAAEVVTGPSRARPVSRLRGSGRYQSRIDPRNNERQSTRSPPTSIGLRHQEKSQRFLLFGVTGSGKTEVYLRAVEKPASNKASAP